MAPTSNSSPPARPVTLPPDPGATADRLLGIPGFSFGDLFEPARLADLHALFETWFAERAPEDHARFAAYRACKGVGMTPEGISEALLAAGPHVSAFVGKLFGVELELEKLQSEVQDRDPLWRFKRDFAKKRVLRPDAGKTWREGIGSDTAGAVRVASASLAVVAGAGGGGDEELRVAREVLALFAVDDVARKAAKGGGAQWTEELRTRADAVRGALSTNPETRALFARACPADDATDTARAAAIAFALDAIEAWLAHRHHDHADPAHRWASLHQPKTLDWTHLVHLRRPEPETFPELFVGPAEERRERDSFALTDRRMGARGVEQEIDYCLYCHERDKDSCSKGMRDPKAPGAFKKNPLGIALQGCPLEEKISEMHVMRRDGDALGALALVCIDNPMCPGTGHRICNDCMKACIFQKQEPVNIPQIETRVLTEVLSLPWGIEIYGFLTRWNPLNVHRPYARPYNGRNVMVVGLGPAGYTLAHHLACEGFGVVAVDGLKVEPLDDRLTGRDGKAPTPIRDFSTLYGELDERILLGFGGVSEYGITARWDKNFLTLAYLSLSRHKTLRIYGGIRFGGTLTLEDSWSLGFDHVAIAAGAGRPTIIEMKNNLSRGIRKASDFLMGLQLTGAYKKSSIANLQVMLPAIVIGGGLTAIDTATELLAYYIVQIEKTQERFETFAREKAEAEIRAMFDDEEWAMLQEQLTHAQELTAERALAAKENREPRVQALLHKWGGVTLFYRKALRGLAGLPLEPRGGREEPRGRGALRRAPLADGGDPRRPCPREGSPLHAPRRKLDRSAGAHRLRRGRNEPQRDVREGVPGYVPARREGAVLPGAHGDRRRERVVSLEPVKDAKLANTAFFTSYASGGTYGLVLRGQPPLLRWERGPRDGEREERLPRTSSLSSPRSRPRARRNSPRATPRSASSSRPSTTA